MSAQPSAGQRKRKWRSCASRLFVPTLAVLAHDQGSWRRRQRREGDADRRCGVVIDQGQGSGILCDITEPVELLMLTFDDEFARGRTTFPGFPKTVPRSVSASTSTLPPDLRFISLRPESGRFVTRRDLPRRLPSWTQHGHPNAYRTGFRGVICFHEQALRGTDGHVFRLTLTESLRMIQRP